MAGNESTSTERRFPPAGVLLLAAASCWALATLWAYSQPVAVGSQTQMLWHYALPTLTLLWTIRLAWMVAVRKRRPYRQWTLLATPVLVVVTVLLVLGDAPFHVRWALSRTAFDQAVTAIRAGTAPEDFLHQDMGAYRIHAMSPRRQGDIFFTTRWNGISATGLVWHDAEQPERYEHYRLHHLAGNWYRFQYPD